MLFQKKRIPTSLIDHGIIQDKIVYKRKPWNEQNRSYNFIDEPHSTKTLERNLFQVDNLSNLDKSLSNDVWMKDISDNIALESNGNIAEDLHEDFEDPELNETNECNSVIADFSTDVLMENDEDEQKNWKFVRIL